MLWCMAAVGVRPGIHPIGLPMEALRSSVWSSETLIDGVNHVTDQAKDFLMKKETESDKELAAEYQVASPLLYIFKLFIVVYNIHIYIYILIDPVGFIQSNLSNLGSSTELPRSFHRSSMTWWAKDLLRVTVGR